MLSVADRTVQAPPWLKLLEIRTEVVAGGQEFIQTQLLADEYVITRIGDATMIFFRDQGRFTVDRGARVLRPVDVGALWAAGSSPDRSRVAVSLQDGPIEVNGYPCRRLTIESRVGMVTLRTESFYASIGGVEKTPLHRDRVLSAPDGYPVHLLEPDEVLVTATTVVRQGDFEQTQTSRLLSLRGDPEDRAAELAALHLPRAVSAD